MLRHSGRSFIAVFLLGSFAFGSAGTSFAAVKGLQPG
jgi:hypothetical protein